MPMTPGQFAFNVEHNDLVHAVYYIKDLSDADATIAVRKLGNNDEKVFLLGAGKLSQEDATTAIEGLPG